MNENQDSNCGELRRDFHQTMRDFMQWRGKATQTLEIISEELADVRLEIKELNQKMDSLRESLTRTEMQVIQLATHEVLIKEINDKLTVTDQKLSDADTVTKAARAASEAATNAAYVISDKRFKRLTLMIPIIAVLISAVLSGGIALVIRFL